MKAGEWPRHPCPCDAKQHHCSICGRHYVIRDFARECEANHG